MIYRKIEPSAQLSHLIKSFWIIDSQDNDAIEVQKIIPDGYPEMIFHYKDPYKINLSGHWELQSNSLLAGQIKNHFFLQNTGKSGMVGIKFMPTAIARLFGLNMSTITNKVITLDAALSSSFTVLMTLEPCLDKLDDLKKKFEEIIHQQIISEKSSSSNIEAIVEDILANKGLLTVSELCSKFGRSERQLERLFSNFIGLSPKFYSRIIRLGHIFELMQAKDNSWADLVYQSGFYDQSHFIKNFKEFTGEDPSRYGFEENNMANFHLKK